MRASTPRKFQGTQRVAIRKPIVGPTIRQGVRPNARSKPGHKIGAHASWRYCPTCGAPRERKCGHS